MLLTWKQRVFDLLLDIFHHIRSWVNGILPTEVWTACEKSDQVFGWSCSTSPTCHPMPKRLRINLKWWLEIGNAQEVVPNTQLLKMIGNWKRSNFNVYTTPVQVNASCTPPRMQVAPPGWHDFFCFRDVYWPSFATAKYTQQNCPKGAFEMVNISLNRCI